MGKNHIIRQFQTARLDEWIGDHKSANLIYEEILNSDNKLSYLLEDTIQSRKSMYAEKYNQLDFNDIEVMSMQGLKYSVSVTARTDKYLKLEIRGYCPGDIKLNINNDLHITKWQIRNMDKSRSRKKVLRELYLTNREDNLKVCLTIDQWGLLCGTFVIDEKNLGDALVSIHKMLCGLYEEITK